MSFDTHDGTRGARQPGGRFALWANRIMARRVRKSGRAIGFDALVLTTIGRKSGIVRETPVGYFPGGDDSILIVASAAGAARNPAWYYNLAARPENVQIDMAGRRLYVDAQQLHGAERDEA